MYLTQNDSTSNCGASMIDIIFPSPVSNLTTTNKVDTNVKNDYNSQSFSTPRNLNHSATELYGTHTRTTQVQIKVNPRL